MVKILVVDDERDVCDFVKTFFEERGLSVLTASNGKEALAVMQKEDPNVVLLDIRMPYMDGVETLCNIKRMRADNKVIMVTCVDDLDKMDEAKRLGADGYITKPLVLDELVKAVMDKIPPRENKA